MNFLTDFHIHSTFSDGKMSIGEIVDLYGSRGFGAIAITDHACEDQSVVGKVTRLLDQTLTPEKFPSYLRTLREEAERAMNQYGMRVIAGLELTKNSVFNSRSAHLLALGVSEFISANGDIAELARTAREQGAFVAAAHPVSTRKLEPQTYFLWDRREELRNQIDAWEVASGPYIFDEVKRSGLPMIANSDLHARKQLSSWKTVLDCERHPEAILRALRRQEIDFEFYIEPTAEPTMGGCR